MAKAEYKLSLNNKQAVSTQDYSEKISYKLDVDNNDEGKLVLSTGTGSDLPEVSSFKSICIVNESKTPVEIQIGVVAYKDNTDWDDRNSVDQGPDSATVYRWINQLLLGGDFWLINNSRIVSYAEQHSAANDTVLDNQVPASVRYLDSGFDIDTTTATDNITADDANTTLYLASWTSAAVNDANAFYVGDLVRVNDEIMEVTAIGDKSSLANTTLTVKRAQYGTSAASSTHADGHAVRLPFFNTYFKEDKFTTPRTDGTGRFHSFNFFGYGRTTDIASAGIVPGSIAIKFYQAGYQELGLSGLTSSTDTGLTANTAYDFTITCDGGAAVTISITVDASNTNFGGKNGLVQKIQEAINAKFSVAGGLFEKRVTVGIVNGDIRFTSQQFLSTSAIALGTAASGDTDIWAVGRIPAVADINGAIAAKLPDDTMKTRADNLTVKNPNVYMFDDGKGNLFGAGRGRVNYETGELDFTSFPHANFVVNVAYNSALAGGLRTSTEGKNTVHTIHARSVNSKIDAKVRVDVYK